MHFFSFSIISSITVFEPSKFQKERKEDKQKFGLHSTIIQDRYFPRQKSSNAPLDYPNRVLFDIHYELQKGSDFPVYYKIDNDLINDLGIDPSKDIAQDDDRIKYLGNPFFRITNSLDLVNDFEKVKMIFDIMGKEYGFDVNYDNGTHLIDKETAEIMKVNAVNNDPLN